MPAGRASSPGPGAGSAGDGGRGLPCGWPVLASSARRYAETSRAPNVTSMATSSDLIEPDWAVLVVGRRYAGLRAAPNLVRARRSALFSGSGQPRRSEDGRVGEEWFS